MIRNLTCPECEYRMEEGFLVDRGDANAEGAGFWMSGVPVKRWWGMSTKGKRKYQLVAYRCSRCGFVKLWAPEPEPGAK